MKKVLKEVLERVVPKRSEEKRIKNFTKGVILKLKQEGYRAEIEGSLAKGTWVSGSHDIDIFIFFSPKTSRETLEREGIRIGKKLIKELGGKPEIAYAEHPYVRSKIKGYDLDIVPCYSHKKFEYLQSSVDRTPFHTKYIKEHITEKQKNQVRVLKQFMKGIGAYSAKESVRGFSGYLCELLILKYGNFKNLIKSAKDWNYGLVIDLEKFYKNKKQAFEKFKHALVVIDPTDKDRNVAAALEEDKFELFILAANEFLKEPNVKFFFPNPVKPFSKKEIEKMIRAHGPIYIIKFKTPDLVEDIVYSQLRSSLHALVSTIERHGFKLIGSDMFVGDYSYFLLDLEYEKLPEIERITGPPIDISKNNQDAFVRKYKKLKPWIENGRWYVEAPRRFTDAKKLVRYVLKEPRKVGIGKFVSEKILEGYAILDSKRIINEYRGEFSKFLTGYLTKKKPWEW